MKSQQDYLKEKIKDREAMLVSLDQQQAALDQKRIATAAELGVYRELLLEFTAPMAAALPPAPKASAQPHALSSSAFQMSQEWTVVLVALIDRARSFDAADVIQAAKERGVTLTVASVRSQFAHYVKRAYIRKVSRGRYNMTSAGKERVTAAALELHLAIPQQSNENGPPNGDPHTGGNAA